MQCVHCANLPLVRGHNQFANMKFTRPNNNISKSTVLVLRMAHRIWKETNQEPGTAGPGNMLGSCFVSIHFMWAILSTSTVVVDEDDALLPTLLSLSQSEWGQRWFL